MYKFPFDLQNLAFVETLQIRYSQKKKYVYADNIFQYILCTIKKMCRS